MSSLPPNHAGEAPMEEVGPNIMPPVVHVEDVPPEAPAAAAAANPPTVGRRRELYPGWVPSIWTPVENDFLDPLPAIARKFPLNPRPNPYAPASRTPRRMRWAPGGSGSGGRFFADPLMEFGDTVGREMRMSKPVRIHHGAEMKVLNGMTEYHYKNVVANWTVCPSICTWRDIQGFIEQELHYEGQYTAYYMVPRFHIKDCGFIIYDDNSVLEMFERYTGVEPIELYIVPGEAGVSSVVLDTDEDIQEGLEGSGSITRLMVKGPPDGMPYGIDILF